MNRACQDKENFITAFAPASIGNVGVGFDMLGLAIEGAGDRVSARRTTTGGISVKAVLDAEGKPHAKLSTAPEENTASIAASALWAHVGESGGVELIVEKGVPLQSGMGSSASSAVAAVVAVNALLRHPLTLPELVPFALQGEQFASGGLHADNVAPSLLGGLVLSPKALLPELIRITPPQGVSSVLVHPELQVNTAEARRGLATDYKMDLWLTQQGYLAAFIAACEKNDIDLLRRCLKDVVIEPQRTKAVPCFDAIKLAALTGGALGCSLSGSGPSVFALCEDKLAPSIAEAMVSACHAAAIDCQSWVSPLSAAGARLE